jgi:hypothetical protein
MPSPFTYSASIPNPPDDPADDVSQMQTNSGSINDLIAIDHVGFNNAIGGYHNIIHFQNQVVTPGSVAGIGQLFTEIANSDEQLFYESGGGVVTQLTGPNAPLATVQGYTWLPGGILMQWGSVTFPAGSGSHQTATQSFNINFPNACFYVIPGLQNASSSDTTASNTIAIRSIATNNFRWVYNSSSSSGTTNYPGFYWTAVGN